MNPIENLDHATKESLDALTHTELYSLSIFKWLQLHTDWRLGFVPASKFWSDQVDFWEVNYLREGLFIQAESLEELAETLWETK